MKQKLTKLGGWVLLVLLITSLLAVFAGSGLVAADGANPLRVLPADATPGTYTFTDGTLESYISEAGPYVEDTTRDYEVDVASLKIVGETRQVNSAVLSGVTVTLYQGAVNITSTLSDGTGNYELVVPALGVYNVTASKDGFRNKTQTISVSEQTIYTLDFVGNYGLIPNAPNMSYVLACINLWKFGTPPYNLNMSTVLGVINAWKFPTDITDISIESGLSIVSVLIGDSSNIGYVVNFVAELSQEYTIQFTQSCSPDNGGISLSTDYPPGWTSDTSESWVVNEIIHGHIIGTYEVPTRVVIVETGQIDEVTTIVKVISTEQTPVLGSLGSDPDAIPISTPTSVLFTTMVSGSNLTPTDMVVEEVDALGSSIATLGSIVDDGSAGDLQSGDYVYSGTFDISSDVEGELLFRAKASFPGIIDPVYSSVFELPVSHFPTDFQAGNMSNIVADPQIGGQILSNEVIVSFIEGIDPATIESIVGNIGGSIVGTILGLGYYQIEVPDTGDATGVYNAINNLVSNPEVRTAEPDTICSIAAVTPSDPSFSSQWALTKIRADEAWVAARGAVTIAVVDTGVDYNHPDLDDKIIKGRNFAAPWWEIWNWWDPRDDHGHGTHVAGIAAAETDNSIGISGVSWGSKILAVKVLGADGRGTASAVADGIRYAADKGAKVINLSLGQWAPDSLLKDAVDHAIAKGALVVAAAGNDAADIQNYPAAYANVLSVGNTNSADGRNGLSNFGNWVRIAAPGTDILSTMPTYSVTLNNPPYNFPQNYASLSGTSMASPMVAGAAAVVWSKHPDLTAAQVQERLERTAKPLPGLQLGAGRIDLFEAIFNGSFETGDLSEWTWTGTAGSLSSLGPLLPQERNSHKSRMGYVSTGPSGDRVWSSLNQAFAIQPGITSLPISFDYNFVTEEYDEFVGTQFNDKLTISIETPGGSVITLAEEEINSSSFSWVTGIDFPGGDDTVGMTGWKSVSITVPVTAGSANFKIYITDAGDDIYNSVVLIDNITFE